jgi:hypothetical protein
MKEPIVLGTPDLLPASVKPRSASPPPDDEPSSPGSGSMRPTRHVRNFVWWAAIVVVAFAAFEVGSRGPVRVSQPRVVAGTETEAFVALRLPRVRDGAMKGEITPQRLRELLGALDAGGFTTIDFKDVDDFYQRGKPLPKNPVLIIIPEAWRETVELADEVLASLNQRAVLFVDVAEVERVNLSLLSLMRLSQLAQTNRWQFGIATCTTELTRALPTAEGLVAQRLQLQEWAGMPVHAADCRNVLADEAGDAWEQALREANLSLGFLRGRAAANFSRGTPVGLHAVAVTDDWRAGDIAARVAAYAPRRATYADHFQGHSLGGDWIVDAGKAEIQDGTLSFGSGDREYGLLRLGGTDNWRDVQVETTLAGRPTGQFWIYARRRSTKPFVRLGVIDGAILVQRSEEDGTRQLARVPIPRPNTTITLRVIGDRAVAYVDGRRIGDRPVDLPPQLGFGPVALAVWGETPGAANTRVASFRAEPLPRLSAVLSPIPTAGQWTELRRDLDSIAEVSPATFEWKDGKPRELGRPDSGLAIFAHYHRLALRPAVLVDSPLDAEDYEPLRKQLLDWAKNPQFDGVNLVLRGGEAPSPQLLAATTAVQNELRADGKELSLTLVGAEDTRLPPMLAPWRPFRTDRAPSDRGLRIASAQ